MTDTQEALLYEYEGCLYPQYLKHGNAMQFIQPTAAHFCKGRGLDIGAGKWPLPGAQPVDLANGQDGCVLPPGEWDFIFSSHAIEHIPDAVGALAHWKTRLKPGGVLFLYAPSQEMRYWQTTKNRKHLHEWQPKQMARILRDLGFVGVINSERDLCWSFAVVGFNGFVEVSS